jgi:hypothetical protein
LEYARQEIEEAQELIGELAHADKLFRPMGGGGLIGPHLLSRAAQQILQAGRYTCVLWSSVPGDWKDQDGWVDQCMSDIEKRDWSVVALHDVKNSCLPRLSEFLDRADVFGIEFRQDFPDDVVMMRRGEPVSPLISQITRDARDAGAKFVEESIAAGKTIAGWEVDRPVRESIKAAGFGEYFVHRTGHSIATEIHANGANMDDLEIHDERRIIPNSCFSIEPGIYLPEFGVRSEINMLVRSGRAEVTGRMQREIVII